MQAEKQQQPPWRISVYARSKYFNFRLKATRSLPFPSSWNFQRLSVWFRIRGYFILGVKSESPKQQQSTLKSRLLRGFARLRPRRDKKRSVAATETLNLQPQETKSSISHLRRLEEPVNIVCWVVGILGFLFRSIVSEKALAFVILLSLALLLKKYVCGRRFMTALAYAVIAALVATVVCPLVFHLNSFGNYDKAPSYISKFVRRAMNFTCKSSSSYYGLL